MAALFALRDYARLSSPSVALPPSTLLIEHPHCIAVFDAYPKAKYHFLVLPRLPFSGDGSLSERDLDSLGSLLRHPARETVIAEMERTAEEVVEMVRDEMSKTEGREWGVNVGFHAVPSMRHIHLHIISDDLISPRLKHRKHYNSFRPDHGFFIHLREVKGWLSEMEADIQGRARGLAASEALLASSLTCFKCGSAMNNIPALKRHLEEEFDNEARRKR